MATERLRQIGWALPEALDPDEDDDMILPAHGLTWTRHVNHDECVPIYVAEED